VRFFVPQSELLGWLNSFYGLEYTKVEDACTGSAYCQVIDSIYPNTVPLHKVNFDARFDYEWIANYKILQTSFDKLGIQKSIDVTSLIKGKRMDNLEFLQWLKRYFDLNYNGEGYDAVKIRENARALYYKQKGSKAPTRQTPLQAQAPKTKSLLSISSKSSANPSATTKAINSKMPQSQETCVVEKVSSLQNKENKFTAEPNEAKFRAELKELQEETKELKETLISMEKERDYYYDKLRKIEILCQQSELTSFVQQVQDIMYETQE